MTAPPQTDNRERRGAGQRDRAARRRAECPQRRPNRQTAPPTAPRSPHPWSLPKTAPRGPSPRRRATRRYDRKSSCPASRGKDRIQEREERCQCKPGERALDPARARGGRAPRAAAHTRRQADAPYSRARSNPIESGDDAVTAHGSLDRPREPVGREHDNSSENSWRQRRIEPGCPRARVSFERAALRSPLRHRRGDGRARSPRRYMRKRRVTTAR